MDSVLCCTRHLPCDCGQIIAGDNGDNSTGDNSTALPGLPHGDGMRKHPGRVQELLGYCSDGSTYDSYTLHLIDSPSACEVGRYFPQSSQVK